MFKNPGTTWSTTPIAVNDHDFRSLASGVGIPYGVCSSRLSAFAKSCPASLGCRIAGLARPELLVEVEVTAVKGAHAGIEWIGPDAVDPQG